MSRLLSAGFYRLKRDKVFWGACAVIFVYAVIYMLNGCRQASLNEMSDYYNMERYYFHYGLSVGLFCSVVTGMFLGTEYGDGIFRNKLIVGHSRAELWLSNLILSFCASLIILCAWLIGGLAGLSSLRFEELGAKEILLFLMISVLYLAAFSAIFTFIGMMITRKGLAETVSLLCFFVLLLWGSMLYQALLEPEFSTGILITAEGMQQMEHQPNPSYVSGLKREVYEFLTEFLPTGQGMRMFDLAVVHPVRMMLSSVFITVSVTAGGIFLFRKKDLK